MRCEWMETAGHWRGSFACMASPCEILIDNDDADLTQSLSTLVYSEALRIEHKYSRYREDSETSRINHSAGTTLSVDAETARLLDYADQCYRLSRGKFDITSGILRKAWRFDGSDRVPSQATVAALLEHIGWEKVSWQNPLLTLPHGMEVDFGGIGKEYAVDRCAQLCGQASSASILVNFGGDMFISGPRRDNSEWIIGINDPYGNGDQHAGVLHLHRGGVATSGDARRFLLKDGVRYSHILDPQSGWPVPDGPRAVTVAAQTCIEAGMLATFAMLQGTHAEDFLKEQHVVHRCIW
ncbi:MAG: FAD:protein FMN transferase [Anaerolineae bacterium]